MRYREITNPAVIVFTFRVSVFGWTAGAQFREEPYPSELDIEDPPPEVFVHTSEAFAQIERADDHPFIEVEDVTDGLSWSDVGLEWDPEPAPLVKRMPVPPKRKDPPQGGGEVSGPPKRGRGRSRKANVQQPLGRSAGQGGSSSQAQQQAQQQTQQPAQQPAQQQPAAGNVPAQLDGNWQREQLIGQNGPVEYPYQGYSPPAPAPLRSWGFAAPICYPRKDKQQSRVAVTQCLASCHCRNGVLECNGIAPTSYLMVYDHDPLRYCKEHAACICLGKTWQERPPPKENIPPGSSKAYCVGPFLNMCKSCTCSRSSSNEALGCANSGPMTTLRGMVPQWIGKAQLPTALDQGAANSFCMKLLGGGCECRANAPRAKKSKLQCKNNQNIKNGKNVAQLCSQACRCVPHKTVSNCDRTPLLRQAFHASLDFPASEDGWRLNSWCTNEGQCGCSHRVEPTCSPDHECLKDCECVDGELENCLVSHPEIEKLVFDRTQRTRNQYCKDQGCKCPRTLYGPGDESDGGNAGGSSAGGKSKKKGKHKQKGGSGGAAAGGQEQTV